MSDFMTSPYERLTPEQHDRAIKAATARVNALKSTGPKSDTGKAISSQNARKHGFASSRLLIDESEQAAFDAHLNAYFQRFDPQDQPEYDAIRRTAEAQWKLDQINTVESTLLELETAYQIPLANAHMDSAQLELRHYRALAFRKQMEEGALDRFHRYRNAASRDYARALRAYYQLREDRLSRADHEITAHESPAEPANIPAVPNEPTPQRALRQDPEPSAILRPAAIPEPSVIQDAGRPGMPNTAPFSAPPKQRKRL